MDHLQGNMRTRVYIEDALKHLHEKAYRGQSPSAESLAGALGLQLKEAVDVLDRLERSGLAKREGDLLSLTERGRDYAGHVIRAHRLYETYLAEVDGLPADLWHARADRQEHRLSRQDVEDLAARLRDPRFDPHGDPIPTREGDTPSLRGHSLLQTSPGWQGRIVHLEDEPPEVFHQLAARHLAPGMVVEVRATDAEGIVLHVDGTPVRLTRALAANLRVEPLGPNETVDETVERLSSLREGETAAMVGLTPACVGPERNRLLDLGVVPGTEVAIELVSAHGSPIAYRIRGAVIALRREQADRILIRKRVEAPA